MDLMNTQATETHVSDGSEQSFVADVVEASMTVPVIVDFWAPWCGPCKTLGPALEKAVNAEGGRVKMVKIDVDQAQGLAGQMRIQSIPTVYAFFQGQPVDGFQGNLPQSEIEAFVKKVADLGGEGEGGLADALAAAEDMLTAEEYADAAETFGAILEEDPTMTAAYSGLARAYLALEQLDQAEAVLNGVPADVSHDAGIEAAFAQVALARQAQDAGPVGELRTAVDANPEDHQARLDLAQALSAAGDNEAAIDELLESFRRDREWSDGAAKAQLFTLFDALGPKDSIAQAGRRKLSSIIFA